MFCQEKKGKLRKVPVAKNNLQTLRKGKKMTDREAKAKAWLFDNKISLEEIETAWNNAIKRNNFLINNLAKNGKRWWWLGENTRLLQQLIERYSNEV